MLAAIGTVCLVIGAWAVAEPTLAYWCRMDSRSPDPAWRIICGVLLAMAGMVLLVGSSDASAAPARPTVNAAAVERVQIPLASARWRHQVEQVAADLFGVDASAARLAAQIHQESAWRPKAASWAGAEGMAQFMPATGKWLAQKFPSLGTYDPWDPEWSLRAAATYDKWLLARNQGSTACASWAFALSAYNGGEARLKRERRAAAQPGLWFGPAGAARQRARGLSFWRENRGYVRRILLVLEPAYLAAGWGGQAVCT